MATTRDQIIDAVEARLALIKAASGYRTDLGYKVRTWQATPPRWEDLPVLQASDPEETLGQPAYGKHRHELTVRVEAILPGGTAAAVLRDAGADVLQAVGTDPTWGGLAVQTSGARVTIDPGAEDQVSAGVTVELSIHYETDIWGA